jgi:hypothetical protein
MKHTTLLSSLFMLVCSAALAAVPDDVSPCQPKNRAKWNCRPLDVSVIRLIANPAEFVGKRIRTVAYLDLASDTPMIYLHREDQQAILLRNGLLLRDMPNSSCRTESYVIIEGVFAAPDFAKRELSNPKQPECLTCARDPSEKYWLHPAGGMLDVLSCMPKL